MIRNEQTFELIERYIKNALQGEELKSFEQRILAEPELKADLKLHQELQHTLSDRESAKFQQTVERIGAKHLAAYQKPKAKIRPMRFFAYAAAIVAIAVCSWFAYFYFNQSQSTEALFADNYSVYTLDENKRGDARVVRSDAINAYQNKDYEKSASLFLTIVQDDAENSMAQFYLANSYMEIGKTDAALDAYKNVYTTANLYTSQAQWYAALANLKLGDKVAAKNVLKPLADKKGKYAIKAQELLKDL